MLEAKEMTPAEKRLAEIKAARAKLAAAKIERDNEELFLAQIEAEERGLADDKAIAEAEEKYGPIGKKIAVVPTDLGAVIVKKPHHVLFKRFQDSQEATHEEFEKLIRPCVVYPDRARFDTLLEELPASTIRIANACAVLAGVKMKEATGK
jgi:hypothetical protein